MTANKDKDFWDRLDVISGLVGTAATIAIAITGAILTWRYNVKQSEYNTISIKTSSIEHLDRQSGEQRETAYNILIRLDPEEFIALSRDYPTRLKIKQLVKYAEDEDKEFSDLAIKALEDIITKYEKESYNLLDNTKKTETIDIIDYIAKGNYKNNKKDNALFKIVEFFNKQQNNNNKQQNNNKNFSLEKRAEDLLNEFLNQDKTNEQNSSEKELPKELNDLLGIVLAGYKEHQLTNAKKEANEAEKNFKISPKDVRVYLRDHQYRVVAIYDQKEAAKKDLKKARKTRNSSYLRNLGEWCSREQCKQEYSEKDQ